MHRARVWGRRYKKILPFSRAGPPWVVAPGEARSAGGQVGEGAAEEENPTRNAKDIENGEAGSGRIVGDFLDGLARRVCGGCGASLSCSHGDTWWCRSTGLFGYPMNHGHRLSKLIRGLEHGGLCSGTSGPRRLGQTCGSLFREITLSRGFGAS